LLKLSWIGMHLWTGNQKTYLLAASLWNCECERVRSTGHSGLENMEKMNVDGFLLEYNDLQYSFC
jgi:hypothetical protein